MRTDEDVVKDLRDKVKSKMDVAKLLGTFLTGLLGGVLAFVGDATKLEKIGTQSCVVCSKYFGWASTLPSQLYAAAFVLAIAVLIIAIILYFATVYAYDRLLMPREFWLGPPFTARLLHRRMIYSWKWLFNPATVFAGLGVFLLIVALVRLGSAEAVALLGVMSTCLAYCQICDETKVQD